MASGYLNPRQVNAERERQADAGAATVSGAKPVAQAQETGGKRDLSSLVPDNVAQCMRNSMVMGANGEPDLAASNKKARECRSR